MIALKNATLAEFIKEIARIELEYGERINQDIGFDTEDRPKIHFRLLTKIECGYLILEDAIGFYADYADFLSGRPE